MPRDAAELVFDEATKVYPGREGAAPRLCGGARAGIRARRTARRERGAPAPPYAKQSPARPSGGGPWGVAPGRALAATPPLMLMDEPFGASDPIVRARLQDEF